MLGGLVGYKPTRQTVRCSYIPHGVHTTTCGLQRAFAVVGNRMRELLLYYPRKCARWVRVTRHLELGQGREAAAIRGLLRASVPTEYTDTHQT